MPLNHHCYACRPSSETASTPTLSRKPSFSELAWRSRGPIPIVPCTARSLPAAYSFSRYVTKFMQKLGSYHLQTTSSKAPILLSPRSWKVKPGQKSSIRTVRLGARDRNGKMLLSNRLYSCINVCSGIKCVELSAGGKRTPERLYKTIRRRYPDMDIKMADEALTQKLVRKEC